MARQPKSKITVAFTAALQLPPDNPMHILARQAILEACTTHSTSQDIRAALGGITESTWVRWKRQLGLDVQTTRPARFRTKQ